MKPKAEFFNNPDDIEVDHNLQLHKGVRGGVKKMAENATSDVAGKNILTESTDEITPSIEKQRKVSELTMRERVQQVNRDIGTTVRSIDKGFAEYTESSDLQFKKLVADFNACEIASTTEPESGMSIEERLERDQALLLRYQEILDQLKTFETARQSRLLEQALLAEKVSLVESIAQVRMNLLEVNQNIENILLMSFTGKGKKEVIQKLVARLPQESIKVQLAVFADKTPQEKLAGYIGVLKQYSEILAQLQALITEYSAEETEEKIPAGDNQPVPYKRETKNDDKRPYRQDSAGGEGEAPKSLSKKQLKALAKKAKQGEASTQEVVASERISAEEYEKLISDLEEQLGSNTDLLGGLKDATEFVKEGESTINSILSILGREVELAEGQSNVEAVDTNNKRRSAVGRLISLIDEITDVKILEKITGEDIARLFDRAIGGNLTIEEAQAEITTFIPKIKPTETAQVSPPSEAAGPNENIEPTKAQKPVESAKPTKPESEKLVPEEGVIDLSSPASIPDFIRQLRATKGKTIEVPFSDGKFGVIKVSSLADVAQRHIQNLAGMAKNPERQAESAKGIIKAAPKDFGYRAGLQKLFIDLKFVEDPQLKVIERERKDEAFRAEVLATISFANLYEVLANHSGHIKEGRQSFPVAEIMSVLGEIERAAERKDGQPVPKSLMAMLPTNCGIQAKAAELFVVNNPRKTAEDGSLSDEKTSPVERISKPSKKVVRIRPGMSLVDIVSQKESSRRENGLEDEESTLDESNTPVVKGGMRRSISENQKMKAGLKQHKAKRSEKKVGETVHAERASRGIQITDDLVARTEAVAIEQAADAAIEAVSIQVSQVVASIGRFRLKFKDSQNQEFKKILEEVETFEVEGTKDEFASKRLIAIKVILSRYQEMLVKIQALEPLLQSELEQNPRFPTRVIKPIAFAPKKETSIPKPDAEVPTPEGLGRERVQERIPQLQMLVDNIDKVGAGITAIISDERNAGRMEEIKAITASLRELFVQKEVLDGDTSVGKRINGYGQIFLKLNAVLKSLQMLLKKPADESEKPGVVLTDTVSGGLGGAKDQPVPAGPEAQPKDKVTKITLTIPPEPVSPKPIPAPLPRPAGESTPLPGKPKGGSKKETVRIPVPLLTPEQKEQIEAKRAAEAVAAKEAARVETKNKKKSEKVETPEQRRDRELKELKLLEEQVKALQISFDEVAQRVTKILADNPQDAEIQAKMPKQVVADILLLLEGKSLETKVVILQEAIATYADALREMAILVQRQQVQANQAPASTGTAPANPRAQPAGMPPIPNTPPAPPQTIPPVPPSPQQPKQNWFKQNWAKVTGIAAIAAAMGFGSSQLSKNISERNTGGKKGKAESTERASSSQGTGASSAETNTVPRGVESPAVQAPAAPDTQVIRPIETTPRVENYRGIDFNTTLLKYSGAAHSMWVIKLFESADRDLQLLNSPEDVDRFFTHYFGQLNIGNREFVKGKDQRPLQKEIDIAVRNMKKDGKKATEFDVKIERRLLTARDLELRLVLGTQLKKVLLTSHKRFERIPGVDNSLHFASRMTYLQVYEEGLASALQKIDSTVDVQTLRSDPRMLDDLIKSRQRAR